VLAIEEIHDGGADFGFADDVDAVDDLADDIQRDRVGIEVAREPVGE